MRFHIDQEQKARFAREQSIAFGNVLTDEERADLTRVFQELTANNTKRVDEASQSKVLLRQFGEIASKLSEVRPLRLGLHSLWERDTRFLNEIFSLQGIACGVLIPLDLGDPVTFIGPFHPIWEKESLVYLIVYIASNARFKPNPNDPFFLDWLREGYSAGDRLIDPEHPIVYR